MDLSSYRATDRIAVNPHSFDAGHGPGIDTVDTIVVLAKAAECTLDPGTWLTPMFYVGLPKDDDDLIALLQLAQIIQ